MTQPSQSRDRVPHSSQPHRNGWVRLHYIVIPIAAFIAILPLILHGCSCGHDFDFHILNWMEAARQFTHGHLHPHWAFTPAYNAGEPRFVFYPPISWTIGAILSFLMPWAWTPIAYTWLALTAAGLALHRLAREFTTSNAALIAATFYLVNPYTLFTAYERTAYAELLAAAWIPLLLHAILREKVTIPRIAIPVALLWLTDAPAAVMGCYALALLTLIRLLIPIRKPGTPSSYVVAENRVPHLRRSFIAPKPGSPPARWWGGMVGIARSATAPAHLQSATPLHLAATATAGTLLGLGLAAVYILPAAYERRYVQITMAILPEMRIQDNFLFHHTADPLHTAVLHTASTIAVTLLVLTAVTLISLFIRHTLNPHVPQISTRFLYTLTILTLTIAFLLTPLSSPIWIHLSELLFLQFPWRLLAIEAAVLGFALALALTPLKLKPTATAALSLALAVALTFSSYHVFQQSCDEEDTVSARLALFHSNTGAEPTDEYTPITADNDALSQTNPPYWLIPSQNADPNHPAPANSTPGQAPTRLTLSTPTPKTLILNLRDYPAWRITRNQIPITTRLERNDGLIAFPIPAGLSHIDIAYVRTFDQTLGDILTVLSLALLLVTLRRKCLPTS